MLIDLPQEIDNKKINVFPLGMRVFMFIYPVLFLLTFSTPFSAGVHLFNFICFLMSLCIVLKFWLETISFTSDGFTRGAFILKKTRWAEIDETIVAEDVEFKLGLFKMEGVSHLKLINNRGKKINIGLPTNSGKPILEHISEELEKNFPTPF